MLKKNPDDRLMQNLVDVFRETGYEGASLSILSQRTGLGKSSLYHHFPNGKDDMAKAALDWVLQYFGRLVCAPLQDQTLSCAQRLEKSCEGLRTFYASGERSCLINIFSIGHAVTLFQAQLGDALQRLSELYSQIAHESGVAADVAEQRGQQAVIQIQGALVMARVLEDRTPFLSVIDALPGMLLKP